MKHKPAARQRTHTARCKECGEIVEFPGSSGYRTFDQYNEVIKQRWGQHGLDNLAKHPSLVAMLDAVHALSGCPGRCWFCEARP